MLWDKNKVASGVDLASPAIELAKRHRNPKPGMCVGPCFQQAPASQLPFADQSFDAIMSTDVLEHVLEKDVPALIQEFARVARHELYLKIATEDEYDKSFLDKIKAQEGSTFGTA